MTDDILDILIVGGGPVGLHAGLKAALLNMRAHIVDKGKKWCRAYHVPKYHNIPGQPDGISGKKLIKDLRDSLKKHSNLVSIDDFVEIQDIERDGKNFKLKGTHHPTKTERSYSAKVVVLATGVVDEQPLIGGKIQTIFPYANRGLVHYCIFCDGALARDQNVAIIGHGVKAASTAFDLTYFQAKKITILTDGKKLFEDDNDISGESVSIEQIQEQLMSEGVDVVEDGIEDLYGFKDNIFGVRFTNGSEMSFDRAFSSLGLYKLNNELALRLGGEIDDKGYVLVDEDCRVKDKEGKTIPGLYAVGDINYNWNQIVIGFGDAERAVIHAFAEYL